MNLPPLTVVIPLRLAPSRAPALARLDRLLGGLAEGVGAVVVDDTADPAARAAAAAVAARRGALHLEVEETAAAPFAVGRLRDLGAAAAPEGWVLFHDLDFAAAPALYAGLRAFAARGPLAADPAAFACVPVWFLTRAGTVLWRAAPRRSWSRLARRGGGAILADRLVRGSSAILVRRARLLDLGGHDPAFDGHGAEDFELLDRLSAGWPLGARPAAYDRDFGARDAGEDGFRAYFGRYGASLQAEGLVMAHLWHPRRIGDARYYAARRRNFALLEERLRARS